MEKELIKVSVEIEGETEFDIQQALSEILRLIRSGCKQGMDSNETGSFHFRRK